MTLWNVLLIVSIILFVAIITILIIFNFIKRSPFYDYHDDELIREKENENSYDTLFFTYGETRKYISKYVFCQSSTDKFVICNYVKPYKEIAFFVVCYNKKKKIIATYNYVERNAKTTSSKIIPISGKTDSVNIIIGKVDDIVVNHSVTRPVPKWKINVFCLLASLAIFFELFIFRHFIALLSCGNALYPFMFSIYNYIAIIASAGIALLAYVCMLIVIRKRNSKQVNGGVVEYEFI